MPHSERPAMAAYGVPEDEEGLLPWSWAEERLIRSRNYWLATVDQAGRPHTMPVWGVWIPDDRFWFSCAPGSLKARNIAANPNVAVVADDTVEVVSVEGRASLAGQNRSAAEQYAAKYEPDPANQSELVDFVLSNQCYEVTPVKAIGVIERPEEFASRATRWVWDSQA